MKKWILNNDGMTQAFRHILYRSAINVAVGVINMVSSLSFIVVSKRLIDTVTGVANHPIRTGIITLCIY